jgi:hypothetical protein
MNILKGGSISVLTIYVKPSRSGRLLVYLEIELHKYSFLALSRWK